MRPPRFGVPLLGSLLLLCAACSSDGARRTTNELASTSPSSTIPGCAPPRGGGEWRRYGQDLAQTRSQPAESVIGPLNAPLLANVWTFSGASAGVTGVIDSTPVVADGCVFAGTSLGSVVALNADTGVPVWTAKLPGRPPHDITEGGAIVGSVTVEGGRVFVLISELDGPHAVALDEATGSVVWSTPVLDTQNGTLMYESAIVYNGVLFAGITGADGDLGYHGSFALVDALTGTVLKHTYTIPLSDWRSGASVWATPAIDTDTGYAYVGTGNPNSRGPGSEHPNANAILKIDLLPFRSTFGEIVGSYHGDYDQYVKGLDDQPACKQFGYDRTFDSPDNRASLPCLQLDLDFGASPNLFEIGGRKVVGELQKSGTFHVVDATTMAKVWTATLGLGPVTFNGTTSAVSGGSVYDVAGPAQVAFSLDAAAGSARWATAVADVVHFESMSVANGVVYTCDSSGALVAFDAKTGALLLHHPMIADTHENLIATSLSNGVAIARNTVFTAAGSYVLAYRPAGVP